MRFAPSNLHLLGIILLMTVAAMTADLNEPQRGSLDCRTDESTAIRFFLQPPGNFFHFPLIFRIVKPTDPRANSAPMTMQGRTAYISLEEMDSILHALSRSNLYWQELKKAEAFGSFKDIPILPDDMQIRVACATKTEDARLPCIKVCETLGSLETGLKTSRALWEYQLYRLDYGCKVEGFKPDAYPDHTLR